MHFPDPYSPPSPGSFSTSSSKSSKSSEKKELKKEQKNLLQGREVSLGPDPESQSSEYAKLMALVSEMFPEPATTAHSARPTLKIEDHPKPSNLETPSSSSSSIVSTRSSSEPIMEYPERLFETLTSVLAAVYPKPSSLETPPSFQISQTSFSSSSSSSIVSTRPSSMSPTTDYSDKTLYQQWVSDRPLPPSFVTPKELNEGGNVIAPNISFMLRNAFTPGSLAKEDGSRRSLLADWERDIGFGEDAWTFRKLFSEYRVVGMIIEPSCSNKGQYHLIARAELATLKRPQRLHFFVHFQKTPGEIINQVYLEQNKNNTLRWVGVNGRKCPSLLPLTQAVAAELSLVEPCTLERSNIIQNHLKPLNRSFGAMQILGNKSHRYSLSGLILLPLFLGTFDLLPMLHPSVEDPYDGGVRGRTLYQSLNSPFTQAISSTTVAKIVGACGLCFGHLTAYPGFKTGELKVEVYFFPDRDALKLEVDFQGRITDPSKKTLKKIIFTTRQPVFFIWYKGKREMINGLPDLTRFVFRESGLGMFPDVLIRLIADYMDREVLLQSINASA